MLVEVLNVGSANPHSTYVIGLSAFLPKFTIVQAPGQPAHRCIEYRFDFHELYPRMLHIRIRFAERHQVLLHPLCGTILHSCVLVRLLTVLVKLMNHWIVMLTYLHHSDPTVPHYRASEWNWLRGALATVDRPLLGWIGRFFLHNVSVEYLDDCYGL
jgi:fatty acid desaturase